MNRNSPPYDANTVANYFIEKADESQRLTPMKLLKLVYFAHGWHLAIYDQPLIRDPVEAWEYGPVIPSLYHALKRYGSRRILEFLETGDEPRTVPESDKRTRRLLDAVWSAYSRYSALRLSDITHMPGTPWYQVYERYDGRVPHGVDISPELIGDYFRRISDKAHAQ